MAFLGNFLEKMIENVERFQTSVAVCVAVGSSCSKSAFFWITHPEPSFNCHVHWIMFIVVSVNCFLVGFSSTSNRHQTAGSSDMVLLIIFFRYKLNKNVLTNALKHPSTIVDRVTITSHLSSHVNDDGEFNNLDNTKFKDLLAAVQNSDPRY